MLLDLNVIKGSLGAVFIPQTPQEHTQPLQAVFLPPELHAPLAVMPSSEILNDSI